MARTSSASRSATAARSARSTACHVAGDDRSLLGGRGGGGGPVGAALGQPLPQRRPGAVQRAGDGRLGQPEVLGGLPRRPPEHVAQDEHRSAPGRQVLEGGDERELDRLATDGDRVGLVVPVGDGLPQAVGEGLQPRDVGPRHHLVVAGTGVGRRRAEVLWQHAAGPSGECVEAGVGGDPVQPGAQGRPALELLEVPPRPQEGLLDEVLGLVDRTEHAVAVHPQLAAVALDEARERRLVAGPGGGDDGVVSVCVGGGHLRRP